MDTVLTLHDWWDGPLLGLATFGKQICIYERIFSEEKDDYLNQYYLTPVSNEAVQEIMDNWRAWLQWTASDRSAERALQWQSSGRQLSLKRIAKDSPNYRHYVKSAQFCGVRPPDFCSAVENYYVIWK